MALLPASCAASPCAVPSKAEQQAYINAMAPRWWFWADGIVARLPVLGSAWLWMNEEEAPVRQGKTGFCFLRVGRYELEMAMPVPDDGVAISIPYRLQPIVHYPWCIVGVPALLVALVPAVLSRALLGDGYWRLRRPWMRLMWRLRPQEMTRRLHAWQAKERAEAEAGRQMRERWAADDAAQQAKREAALEAEVERRLAERLMAAGA